MITLSSYVLVVLYFSRTRIFLPPCCASRLRSCVICLLAGYVDVTPGVFITCWDVLVVVDGGLLVVQEHL